MSPASRAFLLSLAGVALWSTPAAAQWSILGDQQALEGKTVIDVGTIRHRMKEQLPPVQVGRNALPAIPRRASFLEFRGKSTLCFDEDLSASDYELSALLVRDQGGPLQLVILRPAIGSIEVKMRPVEPIACP